MTSRDQQTIAAALIICVTLLFLNLPAAVNSLTKKTTIDTRELQSAVQELGLFHRSELETEFWQELKGSGEEFEVTGSVPIAEVAQQAKLTGLGLAVDSDGEVVLQEHLGKLKPPFNFLIIGSSSMVEGFGPRLESDLNQIPDMTVNREGRYSTGLNRRDYYDWHVNVKQFIQQYKPQALVIKFGGNDGQRLYTDDGRTVWFNTPEWIEAYTDRVDLFMETVSERVDKVFWAEVPIPKTDEFLLKLSVINGIHKQVASRYDNIVYIPTWDQFSIDGKFAPSLPDVDGKWGIVKYSDGIHLTPHGSKIMSKIVVDRIKEDLVLE